MRLLSVIAILVILFGCAATLISLIRDHAPLCLATGAQEGICLPGTITTYRVPL